MISRLEFGNNSNSKEYEVEAVWNSKIYAKELDSGYYLPGFYYLVLWKSFSEEQNTWKLALAIQYLGRLVIIFYCEYPDQLPATFLPINSTLLKARPIVKLRAKASKKYGWPAKANDPSKCTKKS